MKKIIGVSLLILALSGLVQAQAVKLSAQTSATSRDKDTHWETSWGSYDRTISRGRFVSGSIVSEISGTVTVECYWIGSSTLKRGRQTLAAVDKKEITVKAGQPVRFEFGQLFVENEQKYVLLGRRDGSGLKYYGWVIRVASAEGKTLAAQGARPPMIGLVARLRAGQ